MARYIVRKGKAKKPKRTSSAELEARAKYAPKINAVRGQIQGSRQFQKQIPGFYDAYRQELSRVEAATDQRAQAQATQAEASRAAISGQVGADYQRVHGIAAPVQADQVSQQATASRQTAAGVVTGVLGAQRASTHLSQRDDVQKERDTRAGLQGKLGELKSEKSAYKYQVKAKQQKEATANRFKRAALALAQYRAETSARQGDARLAQGDARLAQGDTRIAQGDRRIRQSARQQRVSNRLARERISTTRAGQRQANARAERGSSRDAFNKEVSRAVRIIATSKKPNAWLANPQGLIKALVAKGIDARAAAVAAQSLAKRK